MHLASLLKMSSRHLRRRISSSHLTWFTSAGRENKHPLNLRQKLLSLTNSKLRCHSWRSRESLPPRIRPRYHLSPNNSLIKTDNGWKLHERQWWGRGSGPLKYNWSKSARRRPKQSKALATPQLPQMTIPQATKATINGKYTFSRTCRGTRSMLVEQRATSWST